MIISFFGNNPDVECDWNEMKWNIERKKNHAWFEENWQNWIDKIGNNVKGQTIFEGFKCKVNQSMLPTIGRISNEKRKFKKKE